MKSWLQLNGLWRLFSGQEKKPVAKPEVKDGKRVVLFCKFCKEEGKKDDAGNVDMFWRCLGGAEDAAKAEVVGDTFARVWSIFWSD